MSFYIRCSNTYQLGASLTPAKKILSGPGHKVLPVKGQFVATLQCRDKQVTENVFVAKRLSHALLERPAIESLDLVSRVNSVQSKKNLLCEFSKLFDGFGRLEGEYMIQLREDAKPYALTTPDYPIPMPKVKVELERMERMGVVSHVRKPTDWCAGMVVVPKSGGKVRICVDLTRLN